MNGKKRWGNQDDNGQMRYFNEKGIQYTWNDPELSKIRSKTYQGIAKAMAAQWSKAYVQQLAIF